MQGKKLSDRYEILSELGRGGMGVVYRARDPRLNRDVAVKLIPPSLLTPQMKQRFEAEAQVVAGMDHPAIVPIHDFGDHEESLFFVMPVVEGTSLRRMLRDQLGLAAEALHHLEELVHGVGGIGGLLGVLIAVAFNGIVGVIAGGIIVGAQSLFNHMWPGRNEAGEGT